MIPFDAHVLKWGAIIGEASLCRSCLRWTIVFRSRQSVDTNRTHFHRQTAPHHLARRFAKAYENAGGSVIGEPTAHDGSADEGGNAPGPLNPPTRASNAKSKYGTR